MCWDLSSPFRLTHLSRDDDVSDATRYFFTELLVIIVVLCILACDLRVTLPLGASLERPRIGVFALRMVGLVAYGLPSLRIV